MSSPNVLPSPNSVPEPRVVAVSAKRGHHFSKDNQLEIRLLAGLGVEGDAHMGETVKHRSRVRADPTQPNLRQVHLIAAELFEELAGKGFTVRPGDIGENITTRGIDLLALPKGARLQVGDGAIIEVTGLRNPCSQIDKFQTGLMHAVLGRDEDGTLLLRAGIMGIVIAGGDIRPGDAIGVTLPQEPHQRLERV